ncbi:Heat shock transcription factor [Tieghemiomyces parasiticus]|uniref:Heat shock transcription factor n=1 Tax=Tieghemiomyces parasiticus TaxID=78921 RepID=A0A9W8E141_9FUNG|nr:Heat shock transcription factor [Tieghemiomyces parasiticus]
MTPRRPQPTDESPAVPASTSSGSLVKAAGRSSKVGAQRSPSLPAFLNKLHSIVNDPATDALVEWAEDGRSFFVNQPEDFAKEVLPHFFKHSNFSSFVRQLNMYGFHKIPHIQQGSLHGDSATSRWEFSNPHFLRDDPTALHRVTRKRARDADEGESDGTDVGKLLQELTAIRKHQIAITTELKSLQDSNQLLWQEAVAAEARHKTHQGIIENVLRFLASLFASQRRRVQLTPRKRQLLIEDVPGIPRWMPSVADDPPTPSPPAPAAPSPPGATAAAPSAPFLDPSRSTALLEYITGLLGNDGSAAPATTTGNTSWPLASSPVAASPAVPETLSSPPVVTAAQADDLYRTLLGTPADLGPDYLGLTTDLPAPADLLSMAAVAPPPTAGVLPPLVQSSDALQHTARNVGDITQAIDSLHADLETLTQYWGIDPKTGSFDPSALNFTDTLNPPVGAGDQGGAGSPDLT